ncbi:hypothetical protein BDZ94DRAFT_327325, partial [Collybia nuda]
MVGKHLQKIKNSLFRSSFHPSSSTSPAPMEPAPAPWPEWDLDPKFFTALTRWTLKNPERSLDKILDNICVFINKTDNFLALVPDNPFPARGLVCALAHLIRLGVTISKANREVQQFAKEIVKWVGKVQAAFTTSKGRSFVGETWNNLADMRDLINKICLWATARLQDGRWQQFGHSLLISKEIEDFKSQLNTARNIFMMVTLINLSQSKNSILSGVHTLLKKVKEVQANQVALLDMLQQQMEAEARELFVSQMLSPHSVTNISYDSQGKRPCDIDTRVEVLKDIKGWIYNTSSGAQSFLWLTGDPGCGKSAITASIAKMCKDDGVLWAQFFINRNNADTTDPSSYFPSIAQQLANHSPAVSLILHGALQKKPSLVDGISHVQAGELFVNALKTAALLDTLSPVVVIIDGLDETERASLMYTAQVFSQALLDLPSNVKVFISSRTEDNIRKPFSDTFSVDKVKHVHLDTADPSSIRDVSTFLIKRIVQIVDNNELNLLEWPGQERMDALCQHSAGLFIWAVTATNFIEDQIGMWGKGCLEAVLDELSSQGMGDINVLYGTILKLIYKQADPQLYQWFRRIVGCIVVLKEPLCIADITLLFTIKNQIRGTQKYADVEHFVKQLRTVLVAGAEAITPKTIPRLHKSFFEFITERADREFLVDMKATDAEVALQCLFYLAQFHINIHE